MICFKINILCTSYIAQIKSDLKTVNKKMSMYLSKYMWMGVNIFVIFYFILHKFTKIRGFTMCIMTLIYYLK